MSYFTPANISLIFEILENGSRGLGFTIAEGVTAELIIDNSPLLKGEKGGFFQGRGHQISWNNTPISIPPVNTSIQLFIEKNKITEKIPAINLKSALPLGGGFGLSAASSFSVLKLLNDYFEIHLPEIQLAKIIHQAELKYQTGLGDIQNQYFGGICLKEVSSEKFANIPIKVPEKYVYYQNFGKINTPKIITNKNKKTDINKFAREAVVEIKKTSDQIISTKNKDQIFYKNNIKNMIKISKKFSEKIDIVQNIRLKNKIKKLEQLGVNATIGMIGEIIIADQPFPGSKKIALYFRQIEV
jgi:pantoate kinase